MPRIPICLALIPLVASVAGAQSGGIYEIVANAIGSGLEIAGGGYGLRGMITISGAQNPSGGEYVLHGGFDFSALQTAVDTEAALPTHFAFRGPFPNPAPGQASFRLEMPEAGDLRAEIYSLSGRRVRVLAARRYDAGVHDLHWNGDDDGGRRVAAGIYFVRIETPRIHVSRRVALLAP